MGGLVVGHERVQNEATSDLANEAEALIEEARVRARRRRSRGAMVAALIAAGAAAGFAAAGGNAPVNSRLTVAGGRPAGYLNPTVTARVRVGPVLDVAASDGTVWVAEPDAVVRLDGATGRVVARIPTPAVRDDGHIAVGAGGVWVTAGLEGRGTVYRIDPATDRVAATVRVGGVAIGIAVGGGSVWVTQPAGGLGDVIRIDPGTDRVAGPAIPVGPGPATVVYGGGAVWVQNTSPTSVVRIDPATGRLSTVVGTDATVFGSFVVGSIALGDGSLWTVRNDALTRLDPRTGRVIATIGIARAELVAVAPHAVWVLAAARSSSATLFYAIKHTAALWQVDPATNRIVGKPVQLNGPIALTADGTNVWVADGQGYNAQTTTLLRLTPARRSRG